jgi:hypothetical protein
MDLNLYYRKEVYVGGWSLCSAKLGRWTLAGFRAQTAWSTVVSLRRPINYCMACLALVCVYWIIQEGLAARNYEEGWSRIDGEELAMAANGGSQIERNAEGSKGFWRKLTDVWWALGGLGWRQIGRKIRKNSKLVDVKEGGEQSGRNAQIIAWNRSGSGI